MTLLTETARQNFAAIQSEFLTDLIGFGQLTAEDVVTDYLREVEEGNLSSLVSQVREKVDSKQIERLPPLVALVPVVGTGNQEEESVRLFFDKVRRDPYAIAGNVRFLFLVNRPVGAPPDNTAEQIQNAISEFEINGSVIDMEIPPNVGRINPEIPEMATEENQAQIGVLRNLLDVWAMYEAERIDFAEFPLLLQMDIDFMGFQRGGFEKIVKYFEKRPDVGFLQCASDWAVADNSDQLFRLGCDLMRMLPLVLKARLNQLGEDLDEVIFGEAIQRGIQVPQVRRIEEVARKGSYRGLAFAADELDYNLRSSAIAGNVEGVRSSANIVFEWSDRRAKRAWEEYGKPPISQWGTETSFGVNDPVRSEYQDKETSRPEVSEADVINLTLARIPIPFEWAERYRKAFEKIIQLRTKNGQYSLTYGDTDSEGCIVFQLSNI